jgi:hypothetical protein
MEAIEAPVILDVQKDQHAAGKADAEAGDIDKGNNLVAPEVADGDGEIVSYHV